MNNTSKIILSSFVILNLVFPAYSQNDSWIKIYNDDEVTIEIQNNVEIVNDNIGRITFRWTWAKPHALKMTPGVSYKSRIEKTDINFLTHQYKTSEMVKLFDSAENEIYFDLVVPSTKWSNIEQKSMMDQAYFVALDIFKKYKSP
ncbi:MAG: hypothetical protein ABIC04_06935 [Nanoarchaeota archaeon]